MRKKILLVNPPIYDFSAYDFWLKPYGLLRIGGYLRRTAEIHLFDFLDRAHPSLERMRLADDPWGRGKFFAQEVLKPSLFSRVPRIYRRYGITQEVFESFLLEQRPFDAVLIQTNMTYWYPGVQEVLRVIGEVDPDAKTVLGGVYATLCPEHARTLGADMVVVGYDLEQLWTFLGVEPDKTQAPFWEGYTNPSAGVLKLADGCPFRCTYCSVPKLAPVFQPFPIQESWEAFLFLSNLGTRNIVFYDDALLFSPDQVLVPFLEKVQERKLEANFHTPNALNARFLTPDLAHLLVRSGFQLFYLGFESSAYSWQQETGGKVSSDELERAVTNLLSAGAKAQHVTAYLIVGHPETGAQGIEYSMKFAHNLGIRIMLSEYSPIPGTPDGEKCREWLDLDEPLFHNKTVFTLSHLGNAKLQELKDLCRCLNAAL